MKHKIKLLLRELYARVLFHTGLHALVNRLMPRRLTVLFGHCVAQPDCNGFLPGDMKISDAKLGRIVDWFAQRYDFRPLSEAFDGVANGGARSAVALTMDDGYRDNATALLPLLRERGLAATIFLESRPLDERRVNWSHKYFWLLSRGMEPAELARQLMLESEDPAIQEELRRLLEEGRADVYQVKRILKYEAEPGARDRALDAVFAAHGGDERALCESLYMSRDDARSLRRAGFELGGHTVHHEILSGLDREGAEAEIRGCRDALERELEAPPRSFAYPFGRRWDYKPETCELVREAGFALAVNTHAGTNDGRTDVFQLRRIPIDEGAQLHLLATEACGGFDLLRRVGLDLSE